MTCPLPEAGTVFVQGAGQGLAGFSQEAAEGRVKPGVLETYLRPAPGPARFRAVLQERWVSSAMKARSRRRRPRASLALARARVRNSA